MPTVLLAGERDWMLPPKLLAGPAAQADDMQLRVVPGAGHFLPAERPALMDGVHRALRPGGVFALPVGTSPPVTSVRYWSLRGFDLAMRARNAVRRPPFVMYYLNCPLPALRRELTAAGFTVTTVPLTVPGPAGGLSQQCLLVLAGKAAGPRRPGG